MKIKPLIVLILLLASIGGAYYWFSKSENVPIMIDTTLDRYDATLNASKKCEKKNPDTKTCKKVLLLLDKQIQLVLESKNKKKYEKELIKLYQAKTRTQRRLKDTKGAIKTLKSIIDLDTQNARHFARLSGYYTELGAHKEALTYARLTTQLAPFQWQAFSTLAIAYMASGQVEKSEEAFDKAIELAPSSEIPELEDAREELMLQQQLLSVPLGL